MISIDPGVNGCGVAVFNNDTKELEACYYDTVDETAYSGTWLDLVVIELPQVYMGSKSKGDPNDLIRVAFAAGRCIGACPKFETVSPRKWKGTIKKKAMLKRILSRLSDEELGLLKGLGLPTTEEHNVVDAIGIGLWKVGRL